MASSGTRVAGLKPSFASVVRSGPTIIGQENKPPPKSPSRPSTVSNKQPDTNGNVLQIHQDLQSSMAQLEVKDSVQPSTALNEHARSNIKRAGLRLEDDQTHLSSSSTKPPSLDGKSTTSGTTFAFDEKESLRPDDSASVQAVDDDDIGSGPASGAPNSRLGSEAGSRAFRDQFNEVSENAPVGAHRSHPLSRRVIADIVEEGPPVVHSPHVTSVPPEILSHPEVAATVRPPINLDAREPDEKLFEALDSPRDRMFLLRLEQDIIDFIKNTTDHHIQLPPYNSFHRLLAHKLADYYILTHFVDNAQSAVRLYRTPYTRIPTPLGTLARTHGPEHVTAMPTVQPAMKIMRRPGLGRDSQAQNSGAGTADNSIVPSKAGSEIGDESQQGTGAVSPTDSTLAKDKAAMTRAEREARYKEKRDEIFGPQTEGAESNEAVNEASRTSSSNEEKKRKKKHKVSNDDFEARSQFNAYYPTMPYAAGTFDQAPTSAQYYAPLIMNGSTQQAGQSNFCGVAMMPQGFQQQFQNTIPSQGVPPMLVQNNVTNGYNTQPMYPSFEQQTPTQFYSVIHPAIQMEQSSAAISPPVSDSNLHAYPSQQTIHDQQSLQNGYSSWSQQHNPQQQQFIPHPMQYQYGQLPPQPSIQSGRLAHPLPGSYMRPQPFNPQISSFVPNGGTSHVLPSPINNNGAHVNRHPVSPFSSSGHSSQNASFLGMSNPAQSSTQSHKGNTNRKNAPQANGSQSPVASSLSKWGTPANLPPKPPPPESRSMPDSLPTNNQFTAHIQPLSAGQPMPQYHNGIYSMPGTEHS